MTIVQSDDIKKMAVVGAGEMGQGIAAVKAVSGFESYLHDIDEEQLDDAMEEIDWSYGKYVERGLISEVEKQAALQRLTPTRDLERAVAEADFVTEAATEMMDVKKQIFDDLDRVAPERAILATNTSGLNITELAETTTRPEQVVGTHWFNPPTLMELIEIIETEHTDPTVVEICETLADSYGKTSIHCKRDIPLFIVNRVFRPYGEVSAWLVHLEEAEIREIDAAMKYDEGFPMGPFELLDYLGAIQVWVEQERDLLEDSRPLSYETKVCPLIHDKYDQDHYGRKTGRGFYDYSDQDEPEIPEHAGDDFDVMRLWGPLINEAAKMVQHDVATPEDIDTGLKLGGNWPIGPLEKADEVGAESVVRACVEVASLHPRIENLAEMIPCNLLVENAIAGDTFY